MTTANDYNRPLIEEFRENDGKVGGNFAGAPLMLLTTTGAKSGKKHTTPVVYQRNGEGTAARIFVFASKAGAPENPAWYHNLRANPTVTVELPGETFEARAREVQGDERARIWAAQKQVMPGFAEYEQKTTRTIPVVELERIS
jgi:deazaflavin-dependent oxidoreductase (nitroreductase family)